MLTKKICGYGIDLTHDRVKCESKKRLENLLNCAPKYKAKIVCYLEEESPFTEWTIDGILAHIDPDNPTMGLATILSNVIKEAGNVPVEAIRDCAENGHVLLAYDLDNMDYDYWSAYRQELDEVFEEFMAKISIRRYFPGYVHWFAPVEMKREFFINTPMGKLKVWAKHETDTPKDYPGVYIDLVDPKTGDLTLLTTVEYNSALERLQTNVYGNSELDAHDSITVHKLKESADDGTVADEDLAEAIRDPDLAKAKRLIREFCCQEYGVDESKNYANFSDLQRVDIAYTTTPDDLLEIQVSVDLVNCAVNTYVQGCISEETFEFLMGSQRYHSISDMNDYVLDCYDFEDYIRIPEVWWDKFCQSQIGLAWIRETFPKGARLTLNYMDDKNAPPAGGFGTVDIVDDIGHIHTIWDNGFALGLRYGVDEFYIAEENGGAQV